MNILFSSLSGQNQTQSLELRSVLQRLGHSMFFLPTPTLIPGPRPRFWIERGYAADVALEALIAEAQFQPDFFLYVEPEGLIPRGMERSSIPTACVLCDTHRCLEARQHLARFFDHVFLYHRNYLVHFSEHWADHVHWLPYACDLELFKPLGVERDLDVAFVGQPMPTTTRRAMIIQQMAARYRINEQRYYLREEIPSVYSRAKIVLNMPLADDLNFRTFEAMSCGALLLTQRVNNGQEVLFQEGVHYAAYANEQEMFEKVDHYLAHEADRASIAAVGLAEIRARHRLEQRIEQLLEKVTAAPEPAAPIRRMTPAGVDREYAWLYEYWRLAEPGLRLIRDARLEKRSWLRLAPPAARTILRILLR